MMELDTTRRLDIMSALEGDNTTSRQLGNMLARQQTLQVSMTECLHVSITDQRHVTITYAMAISAKMPKRRLLLHLFRNSELARELAPEPAPKSFRNLLRPVQKAPICSKVLICYV